MTVDEKREALENIALIKDMMFETREKVSRSGGGWIAVVWGIYCLFGIGGDKLFIPPGGWQGVWWMGLSVPAVLATILIARSMMKRHPRRQQSRTFRWFVNFWVPIAILAYTLCAFAIFLPGVAIEFITVFILLVISTGYLIIGLNFSHEMALMGGAGFAASVVTAVFFLEYSDIILSLLFGVGLILTGLALNRRPGK
jgi:hypothetical protein